MRSQRNVPNMCRICLSVCCMQEFEHRLSKYKMESAVPWRRTARPRNRVSIPGKGRGLSFRKIPDRLWGPQSLFFNGYREVFPRRQSGRGDELSRKQRTDIGKCSFVNRTIKPWNELPAEALATFPCKSHVFSKRIMRRSEGFLKRGDETSKTARK